MRNRYWPNFAAVVTFLACGCGGASSITQEQFNAIADATEILATVKDKPSAQAARQKLQPVAARLREMSKKQAEMVKAGNWKDPTSEEQKQLTAALAGYAIETPRLNKTNVEGAGDLIWLLTTAMGGLPEK
jgi:hypothetical protein